MNLVLIKDNIYIDPEQVVSVEHDRTYKNDGGSPSDVCMVIDFDGSKVILKNGRKVFINKMMPKEVMEKLNEGLCILRQKR